MLTKRDNSKFKYFMLQRVMQSSSRDFIFINCYNYNFKHLVCIASLKARVFMASSVIDAIVINYIGVIKLYYMSTEKIRTRRAFIYKGRTPSIRNIHAQDIKQHKLIKSQLAMRQRERRCQEWCDWPGSSRREHRSRPADGGASPGDGIKEGARGLESSFRREISNV